jgi:short-subunit dehydrogenase
MATALITGASGGIGATFARELAKRKYNIFLVARSKEKLQKLAQQLQDQHKIQTDILVQDLSVPGAAANVFQATSDRGFAIDILINNAGFGDYGGFSDRSLERQTQMVQLNVMALMELTHFYLPHMRQQRSGSIINLSSIAGFQPIPYMSVYAATKSFVLSFSESLWAENRDYGVYVQALCPGPTKTNFFRRAEFPGAEGGQTNMDNGASPEDIVRESLKAMAKNQPTVVAGGFSNHLITTLPRFFPRETVVGLVEKQFRKMAEG